MRQCGPQSGENRTIRSAFGTDKDKMKDQKQSLHQPAFCAIKTPDPNHHFSWRIDARCGIYATLMRGHSFFG